MPPKGLFAKLIDGEVDRTTCKGWQGGVMLIIPTCQGALSTSGKAYPLNRTEPIDPNAKENGKELTHAEFEARNHARACATLRRYAQSMKLAD